MNATQDASNNAQKNFDKALLEYNDKQTELIFETRKRLFKLERTQNKDVKILCGMSIGICVILILMCLEFGGLTW
jgi:hypothetical protein